MTSRQKIWLEIAIAYETTPEKRTGKQIRLSGEGLCSAITDNGTEGDWHDLPIIANRDPCDVWWPTLLDKEVSWLPAQERSWTRQCDYERAFFAYLMVAVSDEDYEEMTNPEGVI